MTSKHPSLIAFTLLLWSATPFGQAINTLTAPEKAQGWQLLFDGKTLTGWHSSVPPPGRGRSAVAQPPLPGQVGSPKPCVTQRTEASPVPAGASHWEVVDGSLIACGEPTGY